MFSFEFEGINSFLIGTCRLMLKHAVQRKVRGQICFELPEPYMFKLKNPCARNISIPERKWNRVLPYAESLWIASGRNDMQFMCHYLKRLDDYSDNHHTMRGGYGPRVRHYSGNDNDYDVRAFYDERNHEVDQFRYIEECFKEDPYTRRAVIMIGDPVKDCFDGERKIKQTKDLPCTRQLQFIRQTESNKLDLVVNMRSNDLIYGASGVNIFNFTFMQEYFAAILGMEVGSYIHIANNFHYYEPFYGMVSSIAKKESSDFSDRSVPLKKSFRSLKEFDALLGLLVKEENLMRTEGKNYKVIHIKDEFFQNWYYYLLNWNRKHW